jgi:hypothetical protein
VRLLQEIVRKLKRLDEKADDNFPDMGLGGLIVWGLSAGVLLYGFITIFIQ